MKIGAIGLGNRIAHVYHELSQINQDADLVAFVDPQPIGKNYAEKNNKKLDELNLDELKKFYSKIDNKIFKVLSLENSINSKKSFGGTSFNNIKQMIKKYYRVYIW